MDDQLAPFREGHHGDLEALSVAHSTDETIARGVQLHDDRAARGRLERQKKPCGFGAGEEFSFGSMVGSFRGPVLPAPQPRYRGSAPRSRRNFPRFPLDAERNLP